MKILQIMILTTILACISIFTVVKTIEKHSVHPIYGNYKKVSSDLERCSPWESCD